MSTEPRFMRSSPKAGTSSCCRPSPSHRSTALGAMKTVYAKTDFVPPVVLHDAGVPNLLLTQFDLLERARKLFTHLQPHVYGPGVVPVSDVQLLEGMADLARTAPQLPGLDPHG